MGEEGAKKALRSALPAPQGDPYLPLRALSQYSGLSVRKLRDCLHDAAAPLPHYRIGGRVLVRQSDFDAWAERFRVTVAATLQSIVDDVIAGLG